MDEETQIFLGYAPDPERFPQANTVASFFLATRSRGAYLRDPLYLKKTKISARIWKARRLPRMNPTSYAYFKPSIKVNRNVAHLINRMIPRRKVKMKHTLFKRRKKRRN